MVTTQLSCLIIVFWLNDIVLNKKQNARYKWSEFMLKNGNMNSLLFSVERIALDLPIYTYSVLGCCEMVTVYIVQYL